MDWKSIASLAAPFAPTVGKILGGFIPFPGGALLGEWAGNAIATALGVPPTPEAVGNALQTMPQEDVTARLQAVEQEASAKWEALAKIAEAEAGDRTAQSQAINETQRSEIAAGVNWWHWRHLVGYVVILWFLIPIPAFAMLTFRYSGDAAKQLTDLIQACVPLYGFMCGLLGYIAQDSTKLKTTAITGQQAPSITDNVVTTVKTMTAKVIPPKAVVIAKPPGSRD